ncbi:MAG: sugar phosphate isomerase/epimerase [Anaerolineae bacterium]|nr:sugar phosphate isomerase/epimerase [Anaerolineae bacterium]
MVNPLTFSTLACPHWSIQTIVNNAVAYGYDGVEWRGDRRGTLILHSKEPIEKSWQGQCKWQNLISTLESPLTTSFVFRRNIDERNRNVGELCQYAELAADIDAGHVRAFLGELPINSPPNPKIHPQIAECLLRAADYAQTLGVTIAVEPHDDFISSPIVASILDLALHPALKVIWDVGNTYAIGETPRDGLTHLGKRLAYVHLKDGWGQGDDWQLGLFGQGEVPLSEIIRLLLAQPFNGAFNVEWEWAWHPDLDPPEVALPHAAMILRSFLMKQNSQGAISI